LNHLNVQVTAYGRQTVPDWSVVRSCDPLQNFGAPIIPPERLNVKSSNFVHEYAVSILCNRMPYHQQKGVVMVRSRDCFKILPLVVMQRDARVCQYMNCWTS